MTKSLIHIILSQAPVYDSQHLKVFNHNGAALIKSLLFDLLYILFIDKLYIYSNVSGLTPSEADKTLKKISISLKKSKSEVHQTYFEPIFFFGHLRHTYSDSSPPAASPSVWQPLV